MLSGLKDFIRSHTRTVELLVILVIVAAVPLTVMVSQQQQEIRQRASGSDNLLRSDMQNNHLENFPTDNVQWVNAAGKYTLTGSFSSTSSVQQQGVSRTVITADEWNFTDPNNPVFVRSYIPADTLGNTTSGSVTFDIAADSNNRVAVIQRVLNAKADFNLTLAGPSAQTENLLVSTMRNATVVARGQEVQWVPSSSQAETYTLSGNVTGNGRIQIDEYTLSDGYVAPHGPAFDGNTFTIQAGNKFAFILRNLNTDAGGATAAFSNVNLIKLTMSGNLLREDMKQKHLENFPKDNVQWITNPGHYTLAGSFSSTSSVQQQGVSRTVITADEWNFTDPNNPVFVRSYIPADTLGNTTSGSVTFDIAADSNNRVAVIQRVLNAKADFANMTLFRDDFAPTLTPTITQSVTPTLTQETTPTPTSSACSQENGSCGTGIAGQSLGTCCAGLTCETFTDGGICKAPNSGDTMLEVELKFKGIGNDTGENATPKNNQKEITIEIFDASDRKVGNSRTGSLTFDSSGKTFKGNINAGTLAVGVYRIKIKSGKYLRKMVEGIYEIPSPSGTSLGIVLPKTTLLVGDITGDNKINIQDYNQWRSCINKKVEGSCVNTDLNDDGSNDTEANPKLGTQDILPDFKLLKQSFQTKEGD